MKLTKRQRQLLQMMADGEWLIEEGSTAYVDIERTNIAMVLFFLRHALIKVSDESGGCTHYEITPHGKKVLVDPDFDPLEELRCHW